MKFLNIIARKSLAKPISSTARGILRAESNLKRPNKVLKSYIKSNPTKAFALFRELLRENPSSIDSYSLMYVIKSCTKKGFVSEGKQVHGLVVKLRFEPINVLQTSLVGMYSAGGNVADAHRVFEEMPTRNVVSWTALIAAYVNNQKAKKGLELFGQMQQENVEPDNVTLTVALSACADIGELGTGEEIHNYIRQKRELKADLYLENALIDMYVKCGDVSKAKDVFDEVKKKDVTSWTSMIVGYAINGQAEEALRLFASLEKENKQYGRKGCFVVPNHVTFIGVLMACSHAGMLEQGKRYFKMMTTIFKLKPRLPHYGCMVDLLCRCGMLQDAYKFISAMPIKPSAVIWRTLLSACSIEGDHLDLASIARNKLLESEESLVGDDIVMSNIYAAKGMWDEKWMVRDEMKQRRIPGHSSIGV